VTGGTIRFVEYDIHISRRLRFGQFNYLKIREKCSVNSDEQ